LAWVFVRLKLRMLRNRIARTSVMSLVGFVLLWMGAFGGGILAGAGFAAVMRYFDDALLRVLAVGFNLIGLAWVVVPVVAASLDDSLEPRRFELLPLPTGRLARGLLVAGLVGPGALATLLALGAGMAYGIASVTTILPLLIVAILATLAMAATARWFTTVLSDLLRRRRAQEIVVLVMALLLALPGLASVAIVENGLAVGEGAASLLDALAWTPFGSFASASASIVQRSWISAIAWLAYGLAYLTLMAWAFGRALDRLQTRSAVSGPKAVSGSSSLMPAHIPLPAGPVGGVAAKELRYLRRDVRVRAQFLGGAVAVVVIGFTGGLALLDTPYAPFLAAAASFIVVTSVIPNQFGFDGGSFWGYQTAVGRIGDVIRGKNLGWGIIGAPVALVFALAAALASGRWVYVPASLIASAVVLLVWMAVGNLVSIVGGFRLPESNMFGNRNMSGTAFIWSLVGILASGILMLPAAAAIGLPALVWGPGPATVGALVALGYAVVLYRIGLSWADRLADSRALDLLAAIDREQ
jgi:ABC-2 type transport system permease protein